MACQTGINLLVKRIVKDKPWFNYEEKQGFIAVLPSPKNKITERTAFGVATTLANYLNKGINSDINIGKVFYEAKDIAGVEIKPTAEQLNKLNNRDNKEKDEQRKEVEEQDFQNWYKENRSDIATEEEHKEFWKKCVKK
jgi:hypothetical protein